MAVLARLAAEPAWTVLALDYELGYVLEPHAAPAGWMPSPARPLARFWRFSERIACSAEAAEAWLAQHAGDAAAGVVDLSPALDEKAYCQAVDRIQHWITEGDCYQVNFTFPLSFRWFGSPLALYRRLRARQPVRYGGCVSDGASAWVSLSPELFIERQGEIVRTRPMKGTAPRAVSADVLRESTKDRAENLMIVDLLRNDLGRVAEHGSVRVERLFEIEAYPTVWQMVSEISARVPGGDFEAILRALFPCGSITGAPKIRAMQIAAELEQAPRGLYTGALGWLAPNGDFRLNVAIRTLALEADGRGRMGVGSGIVADSVASAEWQECLLKGRFLTDADPGVQLIETLRLENGQFPHLAGHVARLRRSAACFAFPLDEADLRGRLDALPKTGVWRVRVTLDKAGQLVVAHFPLAPEPAGPRHATLAATPIVSADPLRAHKTTARAVYDAALAGIAAQPEIFDVVFLNERGEVAEGARSSVFVERDGVLLTPPLNSGALPGVLRAALLASGRAREAVLMPADLAGGFWLGNALRGLIPVALRSTS